VLLGYTEEVEELSMVELLETAELVLEETADELLLEVVTGATTTELDEETLLDDCT